ncbi:hypothetical protein LINGRAHAP2_LOCUS19567 [Linum grandiflorum]
MPNPALSHQALLCLQTLGLSPSATCSQTHAEREESLRRILKFLQTTAKPTQHALLFFLLLIRNRLRLAPPYSFPSDEVVCLLIPKDVASSADPEEQRRGGWGTLLLPASLPDDAREPRAPLVFHQENLLHHHHPVARYRRRSLRRRFRPPDCSLLRHYLRWIGSLHRPHHHALHRFVPAVLLSPEASSELPAPGDFHRRHFLCRRIDLCIH